MITSRQFLRKYLLTTTSVIFGAELVAHYVCTSLVHIEDDLLGAMLDATIIMGISMPVVYFLVVRPLKLALEREQKLAEDREQQMILEGKRQQFDASLHRAMELADTEEEALQTAQRVIDRIEHTPSLEILLADSSQAHLRRATASLSAAGCSGCGVESPMKCAAVRRAQTLVFQDSESIDACPRLINRPEGRVAAVCVPISISGRAIGVLHAMAPFGTVESTQTLHAETVGRMEVIATQVGARVGILRAMESSQLQAGTDPLTGLPNRRAFDHKLTELIRKGMPYALAVGDLDHFKKLNDTHGHEVGDRALRVFAQVLKSTLRGEDIFCRFGGEEFAIVLAGVNAQDGTRVLDRIREVLATTMLRGSVPPFTVSFGVADSTMSPEREDLLRLADEALYAAKRAGRNRVMRAGEGASLQFLTAQSTSGERESTPQTAAPANTEARPPETELAIAC